MSAVAAPAALSGLRPEIESRLAESTVELALRARPAAAFWRERDAIYELGDEEARDRAFAELHGRHFALLELGAPIAAALREQPAIAAAVGRCHVLAAASPKSEGAELFVDRGQGRVAGAGPPAAARTLVLRLLPATLLAPERLQGLLRHELGHIADMLDPRFAYDPTPPELEESELHPGLILARYRALWDLSLDARLIRRGLAETAALAPRQREFLRTFACLGDRAARAAERVAAEDAPTHPQLLRWAIAPREMAAG
jgi:hypothetical protein